MVAALRRWVAKGNCEDFLIFNRFFPSQGSSVNTPPAGLHRGPWSWAGLCEGRSPPACQYHHSHHYPHYHYHPDHHHHSHCHHHHDYCCHHNHQVADLSHWVNVAETNSSDPDLTAVIERLAAKFHHTHCRFDDDDDVEDEADVGDDDNYKDPDLSAIIDRLAL